MPEKFTKVLIVGSTEDRLREILEIFERMENGRYNIDTSLDENCSTQGSLEGINYDVVICDHETPSMNSLGYLKYLRSIGFTAPILMIVGKQDQKLELKARQAGVDDFLVRDQVEPLLLDRSIRFAMEAKRSNAALLASHELYKALAKSSPIGTWHTDKGGETLFMNHIMCRMLQIESQQEISGKTYHQFFTKETQKKIEQESRTRAAGTVSSYEGKLIGKKGRNLDVLIAGGPFITSDGQFNGIIGTFTDITKIKEEELLLSEAKERAEEATKLKDKFVSLVAHDLRGPLSTMLSYLRLVRKEQDFDRSKKSAEYMKTAIKTGHGMLELIKKLLDISRLKTGKLQPQMKFFNLRLPMIKVASGLDYSAEKKGITITREIAKHSRVFGDPVLIEQVLQNLLSNAVKFCGDGDNVTINVRETDVITISVTDTGIGIEPERQNTIFDYEAKTSTTGTAGEVGTGLGLPLCRDIMQAHDGELTMKSSPGNGSSFCLTLPIRHPLVMVVESDDAHRKLIAAYLKKIKADVIEAVSGDEAIRIMETDSPSLIILDQHLIASEEDRFMEEVRKNPSYRKIPIVAMTGGDEAEAKEKDYVAGASDFIKKPFEESDLIPLVRLYIG